MKFCSISESQGYKKLVQDFPSKLMRICYVVYKNNEAGAFGIY